MNGALQNPIWEPGTPGVYAVIIGVSRYDHLQGAPPVNVAPDPYDLSQLGVSALTAHRFYDWLIAKYQCESVPLAKAWVLLSPSPDESRYDTALGNFPVRPTLDNCTEAIEFWAAEMNALPPDVAAKSRAVFFFSGHGLERFDDEQILLPCDYLRPPGHNPDDAISTNHLKRALASCRVPTQLFFLDACRNDHHRLLDFDIQGRRILAVQGSRYANPARITLRVYATASGLQAWAPATPTPGNDISLFGQALLEGLGGEPDMELECVQGVCKIAPAQLQAFLTRRVAALHREHGSRADQPVRMFGHFDQLALAEVSPRPVIVDTPGSTGGGATLSFDSPTPTRGNGWESPDEYQSHDWRDVVESATFRTLEDAEWYPAHLEIYEPKMQRLADGSTIRLTFLISSLSRRSMWVSPDMIGTIWLRFVNRNQSFTICIPDLSSEKSEVKLLADLFFLDKSYQQVLDRVEVSISPETNGVLGEAVKVWWKYRMESALHAAAQLEEQDVMERALREKMASPISATLATIVLLRANHLERLHDWVENLARLFPSISDGQVLLAEQRLRQGGRLQAIQQEMTALQSRPLPAFADAFSYLVNHARDLEEAGAAKSEVPKRVNRALKAFRSGGMFCTFVAPSGTPNPEQRPDKR
ncbi:caspase family protein [Deinococcus sp. AJ005]|uniref:caspase family protein n=1 Tax=Deinococcus sp. AJ005 TaxID=2652443 RepID=UPI00125CA9C4|nr:caspase family protein [Deinococcus sp. AJ005]QFP75038.1 hypothetical protein DAAJ005_00290 [Deinococcus sp. AJ005]